jgi:hypothetical protein
MLGWIVLAGCGTDVTTGDDAPPAEPTWHGDIAPLVAARCQSCHTAGGIAPFALTSYEEAGPVSTLMLGMVERGAMPPWGAGGGDCEPPRPFVDDPSLSADEVALMKAWVAAGAPEGDPATAAPLPDPGSRHLDGVTHDVVPLGSWTTSGTSDQFICLVYDPQLAEDAWLTGIEFLPTDKAVVHHAAAFKDPTRMSAQLAGPDGVYECFGGNGIPMGEPLGAYTPGALPFETLAGTATRIPAGSLIVVQIHYHPLGADQPVTDATALALRLTSTSPGARSVFVARGNDFQAPILQPGPNDRGVVEFRIPADVEGHTETMVIPLDADPDTNVPVWSVFPHMHYVGTRMKATLLHADGSSTCLIDAGRYDFNWQRMYSYAGTIAQMPRVRYGDTLVLECTYDNTLANPNVQKALAERGLGKPIDVYSGEETLDEMCILLVGAAIP